MGRPEAPADEELLGLGKDARYNEVSKELGPLSLGQFYLDCINVTRGFDFREGHGVERRDGSIYLRQHTCGVA